MQAEKVRIFASMNIAFDEKSVQVFIPLSWLQFPIPLSDCVLPVVQF